MAAHIVDYQSECRQLLLALKSTVEGLLVNHTTNVWNTYGGLSRLSNVVHDILNHRLRKDQDKTRYWKFIVGLRVLVPTLSPWLERHHLATEGNVKNRGFLWIRERLQEHSLSTYLKILLNDRPHLNVHYQDAAFLRHGDYVRALLTCLQAVENNQLTTLAELDPTLLVDASSSQAARVRKGRHVRSPSLPTNILHCHQTSDRDSSSSFSTSALCTRPGDRGKSTEDVASVAASRTGLKRQRPVDRDRGKIYRSAICLDKSAHHQAQTYLNECVMHKSATWNDRLATGPALPRTERRNPEGRRRFSDSALPASHSDGHTLRVTKSSLEINLPENDDATSHGATGPPVHRSPSHHVRSRSDVSVVSMVVESEIPMSSSLPTCLSEVVDGFASQNNKVVASTPIFRRPVEGQSLTSFLSSQDFRTCAELDKENAHFSISEALIAAIEQIKCNQTLKIAEEEPQESDDEEIKQLRQRIRIRRRERLQEKTLFKSPQLMSDGRTDTPTTTTTSQSPSPQSISSDGNTSDSVDPIDVSDGSEVDSKLSTIHESGLSLSMASLYSDADIQKPHQLSSASSNSYEKSSGIADSVSSCFSAESVALSLIRKFSEKQLPKASDLEWLVSEQDAPQKLLPLPSSWPVSPDDAETVIHLQTRLRGNFEWAPPRPQIIFSVHPSPQRKVVIAKQNYRCAGCGTKVEQGFMKRFRYCEYLGKYFCQCCHNNSLAYIPGRILRKWDFARYCVSNFSRDLLEKIFSEPLCDVEEMNPSLYRRVRALNQVQQCRMQLYYVKDFVRACRACQSLTEELDRLPYHILSSPHQYSLLDLLQVKSGDMLLRLKPLLKQSLAHVSQCQLCQARGFFCEICKNDSEVIFPFQTDRVVQCSACRSCYHHECYVADKCPKCARIELRRQRLLEDDDDDSLE